MSEEENKKELTPVVPDGEGAKEDVKSAADLKEIEVKEEKDKKYSEKVDEILKKDKEKEIVARSIKIIKEVEEFKNFKEGDWPRLCARICETIEITTDLPGTDKKRLTQLVMKQILEEFKVQDDIIGKIMGALPDMIDMVIGLAKGEYNVQITGFFKMIGRLCGCNC